ncbi:Dbl homology domain-containing protein [Mycena belliarum]|uniref:Dbl homology domain-containing protein n=1 Tax=Mycena belliarum TaxID=1033014 RepID=A0AAD6U6S4_9AGAR|nr:Dbl homology domain-containing protein [Mycena belliae]
MFGQGDILKGHAERPASLAFSHSSSASSVYDDDDENEQREDNTRELWRNGDAFPETDEPDGENQEQSPTDDPGADGWRQTLPPKTYAAIVHRCGPLEIHRQEAIHALCVTEESFVARLRNTINLFILPLRLQDSKCYISGVPSEIAKLFDWFEDILNLHMQLLSALCSVQDTQHPVVDRVAEAIRGSFVKRLEVYQPYLARLVNVAGVIARLVADLTSDFGEFVRIQEGVRECQGWTLEGLLVDPVTRLGRYPEMFRELHQCTPKAHVDHVPTFVLLHSTEMVIKVMTEVKIREDEYDLVKSISRRIKGLPSSAPLAKRGRRLLFHGQLFRVPLDIQSHDPCLSLSSDPHKSHMDPPKRASNLVHAIHEWDKHRERSGSVKSNGSASTTTSSYSYAASSSSASSEPPVTPSSPHFATRSSIPVPRSNTSSSHSSTSQEIRGPCRRGPSDSQLYELQLLQIFVFTDFLVLADVSKSRQNESEEWALLEKVGIGKVIGVAELPVDTNNGSLVLELDILPLDIKNLGDGVITEGVSLEVLRLRVPGSSTQEELHKTCSAALEKSAKLTVRSISTFPLPGEYADPDRDYDTHQRSVSRRPLPKSPSLIAQNRPGDPSSPRKQEREERGWWSACFHQVLKEFQTREVS